MLSCTKCRCSCMLWSLSKEAGQVPVATSAGAVVAPGTSNRVGRSGAGSVRIYSKDLAAVSNYFLGRLCASPSSGDALCQPCTITISVPSGCRCCCCLLLAASCAQLPARVGVRCGSLSPCPGGGTKHGLSVQNGVATRVLNLSWLFTYAFALFV